MALDKLRSLRDRASTSLSADPTSTEESPSAPILRAFGDTSRVERDPPKDKMEKYWRTFETVPIVRQPIRDFAAEVIEPGWRIEADSDETQKQLEEWAASCAIVAGQPDKNIRHLLKDAIIQREVRGTTLIEHVPDDQGNPLQYLKLINPETVSFKTYPNQSLLPEPDAQYDGAERFEDTDGQIKTAAYVQWDSDANFDATERDEIYFTKEQITKLTRDADVGDIFGTSRVEAVYEVIEGLVQKIQDNNQAIAAKAYPVWLFFGGTEDFPWPDDELKDFTKKHEPEEFEPGMKQAVAGDLDVEVISGEVAEIIEYLEFDIDWIMSAMPMPKYELGSFEENINQFVSEQQEKRVEKQIREARNELESEMIEIFRKKAELEDLDDSGLKFKLEPKESDSPILDDELDMDRLDSYASAIALLSANAPQTLLSDEEIRQLILQLPEDPDEADDAANQLLENEELSRDAKRLVSQAVGDDAEGFNPVDAEQLAEPDSEDLVSINDDDYGLVVEKMTSSFGWPDPNDDDETIQVEASAEMPAFIVARTAGGSKVYRESELEVVDDWGTVEDGDRPDDDGDPKALADEADTQSWYGNEDVMLELWRGETLANIPGVDDPEVGFSDLPNGWDRISVLKAWQSLGMSFTTCVTKMTGDVRSPKRWCAAMKDEVLGTERWRNRF